MHIWRSLHSGLIVILLITGLTVSAAGIWIGFISFDILHRFLGSWMIVISGLVILSCAFQLIVLVRLGRRWIKRERSSISFAQFRILFYLVISSLVALLVIFNNPNLFILLYTGSMVFGAWTFILLFQSWLLRLIPRALLKTMDVLMFNLCLLLLVGEIGLRLYGWIKPSPLFARDSNEVMQFIDMNRYPPGELRYGFYCNDGGHYDSEFVKKKEGELLVVAIGDSFSAGVVPHHFHFTTVCERLLPGLELYNMGVPCIGPKEYLHMIQYEALPMEPDLIVINIFMGNDISSSSRKGIKSSLLDDMLNRNNYLLYLIPQKFLKIWAERRRFGLQAKVRQGELPRSGRYESVEEAVTMFPWVTDPMREEPHHSVEKFMEIEMVGAWNVGTEDMSHIFDPFFNDLEMIRQAAGEIPLAVMLIPDEFQVEETLWEDVREQLKCRCPNRFYGQERVTAWLEEKGVPYLDLLPILRAEPELDDGRRHLYHLRDTHFNAKGNEVVGRALADFIKNFMNP